MVDFYKERALKLARFNGINLDDECKPIDPGYEMTESDLFNVLNEVFSVDPRSGFPRGDIAYYLSPDGNPQVKQWLENNLLKPRMGNNSTPEGVTDDMIVEMSRKPDETVSSYQSRLMDLFDSAKQEYQRGLDALKESDSNE